MNSRFYMEGCSSIFSRMLYYYNLPLIISHFLVSHLDYITENLETNLHN
jgi:hypothetical protein